MSVSADPSSAASSSTIRSLFVLSTSVSPSQDETRSRRARSNAKALRRTCLGRTSALYQRLPTVFGGSRWLLGWDCSCLQLVGDVAGDGRVDVDTGPHRSRHRDLLDVTALRSGGLRANDLVQERRVVFE